MKTLFAFLALALLAVAPAPAAARSIGDCEKIADPDTYNRCLASFGPAARTRATTAVPAASNPEETTQSAAAEPRRYGKRGRYSFRQARRGRSYGTRAQRGGRVRMEFNVGSRGGYKAGGYRTRSYGGRRSYRRRR